jgi:7,8-dihydropterin-6-yl-methyl-4-(beta-D-ribofuranosyl)aminobenzene 5'-phosphate synthase
MADRVKITVVVDNSIDIFMPPVEVAEYPVPGKASSLWAEQGLSLWVDVSQTGESLKLLYDFGRSDRVLFHNAEILGLDFKELDYLVLSHGHIDHYGCLYEVLKRTGSKCKLVIHPEAIKRKRYVRLKDGSYAGPWKVHENLVKEFGSRILENSRPSDLGLGIHVSGEIRKENDFEKGMADAFWEREGKIVHDEIEDDQALLIDMGLPGTLVLTGCCHSGLVNTLACARRILPGKPIYAALGGLHLNQAGANQMNETIAYLSSSGIRYFAGFHCTGYYAQKTLMDRFGERWLASTVGAQFTFPS